MNVEGIVPLSIRIGDLCICTGFEIVENLDVDVLLGMSFIHQYIRAYSQPNEMSSLGIQVQWHLFQLNSDQFDSHRYYGI